MGIDELSFSWRVSKKDVSNGQKHLWLILICITTIGSIFLKLYYINDLSLWLDEAYTVYFVNQSFHDLWFVVPEYETHPPFYYTLTKLWSLIIGDSSGFFFRHFSVLISILAVPIAYSAVKSLSLYLHVNTPRSTFMVVFFVCFSPFLVWYSLEARPYILFFVAYLLAFYGLIEVVLERQAPLKSWTILVVGSILTNWSHSTGVLYTFCLFVACTAHWLLFSKKKGSCFRGLCISSLIVFIATMPLIIMVLKSIPLWSSSTWVPEPSLGLLKSEKVRMFTFQNIEEFIYSIFGYNYLANVLSKLLKISHVLLGVFGIYSLLRLKEFSFLLIFILSCVGFPLLGFLVSVFGPNILLFRVCVPILGPYLILLSLSIVLLKHKNIEIVVCILFCLFLLVGTFDKLRSGYKEPWNEITNSLVDLVADRDRVFLLSNEIRLAIQIYDKDSKLSQRMVSLPAEYPALHVSDFYPAGTPSVPGIRETDSESIAGKTTGVENIYYLTRKEKLFDPKGIVKTVLKREFTLVNEKHWKGIILYYYAKK